MDDFFNGYSKPINRELMRVFKDVELVEYLGSGIDRILPVYGKKSFQISENFMKNVFMFDKDLVLQNTPQVTEEVTEEVTTEVTEEVQKLLEKIEINKEYSRKELQKLIGLKHDEYFRQAYINPLLEKAILELTIPDKPTSSKQKYKLTSLGKKLINPPQTTSKP